MATFDTADGRRRSELGAFLKTRRAQLRPEDVGLPPGERRRTAGLRREEVALLAGVGITWYTWLEQGRPINASIQVLDAVARTLKLDRAERRHLYELAEATPRRDREHGTNLPPATKVLLQSLQPLPATLVNGRFDVFVANDVYRALFRDWHTATGTCVHRNVLWCCVTEPMARCWYVNYDAEIAHMVARMRAEYARHVGDPDWEEDIRRLQETNEEFARLWARHEVAEPAVRHRIFELPEFGRVTFSGQELAVSAVPGLTIQVNTPQDAHTWSVIKYLAEEMDVSLAD
ncbi:transcriptional regulator with XRE-family HTH domain [Kibdelosporangium banguiense]|uniref:Transcriptional regulator with XRE-family HTH domain n=1 Tax=Kibdelosporangium banguiense TaxID=1365924 RepID=A0ABS4TU11_9PSEU|nr:helix-turn-helix transcriptional regulator [Kibdelosporangium banguiense]MBP2327891.1 transcriptional regulator with XRE-family HTH domain [Kibdelosporangium banguiense]